MTAIIIIKVEGKKHIDLFARAVERRKQELQVPYSLQSVFQSQDVCCKVYLASTNIVCTLERLDIDNG